MNSHDIWFHRNRIGAALTIILSFTASQSVAQDSLRICETLALGGLIDKTDRQITQSMASREWHEVCADRTRRQQNYNTSSAHFQGTFKAFGLGGGQATGRGMSSVEIDKTCDIGEKSFSDYLSITETIVVGSYLSQQVNECMNIALNSGREFLSGTTEPMADTDDRFVVDFRYVRGESPVDYVLDRVEGSEGVACFLGSDLVTSAIGVALTPQLSFTCTRPNARASNGRFMFRARAEGVLSTKRVEYAVSSVTAETRALERLRSEYKTSLDRLRGEISNDLGARLVAQEQTLRSHMQQSVANYANTSSERVIATEQPFVNECSAGQGGSCYDQAVQFCRNQGFITGFISGWLKGRHVTTECVGKRL